MDFSNKENPAGCPSVSRAKSAARDLCTQILEQVQNLLEGLRKSRVEVRSPSVALSEQGDQTLLSPESMSQAGEPPIEMQTVAQKDRGSEPEIPEPDIVLEAQAVVFKLFEADKDPAPFSA
ncbi:hypothetical protein PUN28_006154 [Cardiocondyla obscurior]|uniref:Uncharacterized protein n=1 Tax=Cardiocondyla obscurior TaxID=286306 RepID=A0AAW2GCR6_9HYME